MPSLLTIPNELLDEIVSYLDPLATSYLLITCRSLSYLLTPAMLLHAVAPKHGVHALHWATRKGHLPLVQYLITRFPIDLPNNTNGDTALHYAAWPCTSILVVEHLLLHGAAVNRPNSRGYTPLHYACRRLMGTEETAEAAVRLLIAHGADVHGEPARTPLRTVLRSHFPRVARLLLDAGASPNSCGSGGVPHVVAAARTEKNYDILELLLDYGADIDACNPHASNALLIAAGCGSLEKVKLLVARGAKLDCEDHDADTPVILAIMHGRRDIAEFLVGLDGVDIRSANLDGKNPLYLAALMGYDTVLQALLERGASIHDLGLHGETALYTAVVSGWETIATTLLDSGANIETPNVEGVTPLLSAIRAPNAPMAMMLLERGADPAHTGPDGLTPLTAACQCGLNTIVGLLLEKGVDVNSVGEDGLTAMSHARMLGNSGVVEILTAYGGIDGDGK